MRYLILVILSMIVAGQKKPQQTSPSLDSTLTFMQNTLSRYGYIHTEGKDQELNLKGDEPCRIYVEWEITVLHTHGVYPIEYQFHLGTIDPNSVKVVTDEKQKKPEGWKLSNVHLATTNNESTIWASASEWKESEKVPKSLQLASFSDFDFQFRDKEQAERFAKAPQACRHSVRWETVCVLTVPEENESHGGFMEKRKRGRPLGSRDSKRRYRRPIPWEILETPAAVSPATYYSQLGGIPRGPAKIKGKSM